MEHDASTQRHHRLASGACVLACLLAFFGPSASAKFNVVTTTQDLASIARSIGGDRVNVVALAKGTQDPHFVSAKPSYLVSISRADLVVCIGSSLEVGWLPLLIQGARQPKLMPGQPAFFDASSAVQPIEVNVDADRSQGDVHPLGNPHYMVDPERGILVSRAIADRMKALDPQGAAEYTNGQREFERGLRARMEKWKPRLAKLKGMPVIAYHQTFNYLLKGNGAQIEGYLEPKPGLPPTPRHVQDLIAIGKAKHVKAVIMEDFFEQKPAKRLAEQIGAKFVPLPAYTGGEPETATYESWLEAIVERLDKGVQP